MRFILYMLPIWVISGILLVCFILFLYRKNIKQQTGINNLSFTDEWSKDRRKYRIAYICIFTAVIWTIVSRTDYWLYVMAAVIAAVLITDRKILLKTDYVLLATFACFFIFSSSIAANGRISAFLSDAVANREYMWGILLSQFISNVPASIVIYPFAVNKGALLYGLDTAGLCTVIGSLASVINYRIYIREYPQNSVKFLTVFTLISLAFFAFVVIPGYFISLSPL